MLIEVFGSLEWKRKRESAIEGLLFCYDDRCVTASDRRLVRQLRHYVGFSAFQLQSFAY
jgi:hypothetical protein